MNLPPPNPAAHDDGRLMHDLASMNTKITRYILNFLDADAGRTEPLSIAEERAIADEFIAIARRVQVRAKRRAVALGEECIRPRALEAGHEPRTTTPEQP